ncbi:hypothetical protein BDF20DRAFT_867662 [Mycotypha africana]|uniref:uncharacterized protein n=1 Tax=Mycotypha africana TaxID=64632 RepID=UPI0023000410|nr:uncharacterized protein BDF20DRAFT_867662 [Mycotypha africana]KAI8979115.1 hypothetical protein BDF20DRAFT_867662 [Mycotypha africana]
MNGEDWKDIDYSLGETQIPSALKLDASIVHNICRFLNSRKDRYEATLIHPKWSYAAHSVLWEEISFDHPSMFRKFYQAVMNNNKSAQYVKSIQFTLKDRPPHPHSTHLFNDIIKSTSPRHAGDNGVLTKRLDILLQIVKACENITTLAIYGWCLKSTHVETLATIARNLSSLYLIGADPDPNVTKKLPPPIHIKSIAPRLRSLRLDGDFKLNDAWAAALVQKAARLEELQLSLTSMNNEQTLQAICSQRLLHLTKLILTDAAVLYEQHITCILRAFPKLTHFCLEGVKQSLSLITIIRAVHYCPQLRSLEIRASPSMDDQASLSSNITDILRSLKEEVKQNKWSASLSNSSTAMLSRFVIENMPVTDVEMQLLSPYLRQLQTLGLKNCPNITDTSFDHILVDQNDNSEVKYLRIVHIIQCQQITSTILSKLATSTQYAYQTVQNIYIDQCGEMTPKDIYQLCHKCADYNLRHLTLVNYLELKKTVVGSFNNYRSDDYQPYILYLDRQAIDGLANTTDSSVKTLPKPCSITGVEIVILATHLNMDVDDLVDLLHKVKEEANDNRQVENQQQTFKPVAHDAKIRKPADRLQQLKMEAMVYSQQQRPTTPALWSSDLKANDDRENHSAFDTIQEGDSYEEFDEFDDRGDSPYIDYSEEDQQRDSENSQYDEEEDEVEGPHEDYDDVNENSDGYENTDGFRNNDNNGDNGDDIANKDDSDDEEEEYVKSSYLTEFRGQHAKTSIASAKNSLPATWRDQSMNNYGADRNLNLGSWGSPANITWASSAAASTATASVINGVNGNSDNHKEPLSFRNINPQQQQQSLQQQFSAGAWNAYKEENYRDQWKQDPLTSSNTNDLNQSTKHFAPAHHRNAPNVIQSDGWGQTKGYTPWEQTEGYVKDVIDEQSKQEFWSQSNDGKWIKLSSVSPSISSAAHHNNDVADSGGVVFEDEGFARLQRTPPPPLITDIMFSEAQRKAVKKQPNKTAPNTKRAAATTNTMARFRANSVVSSDNSVSWDDEDKDEVILKTYHNNNKTATTTNQNKQNNTAGGFNGKKAAISGTSNAAAVRSWHEHFKTEDIESKAAKDTWSSYPHTSMNNQSTKQTFSRSPGPAQPRTITSSNHGNNSSGSLNNSLASIGTSDNNNKIPRASTPTATETLIDTDNTPIFNFDLFSPAINDKPANMPTSDLWDSISNLSLQTGPQLRMDSVLTPTMKESNEKLQQASSIPRAANTTTEVIDFFDINNGRKDDDIHFVQSVPGTTSEREMQMKDTQEKKDTLVSLLDDNSSSNNNIVLPTPTITNTGHNLLEEFMSSTVTTPQFSNAIVSKKEEQQQHEQQQQQTNRRLDRISSIANNVIDTSRVPTTSATVSEPATTKTTISVNNTSVSVPDEIQDFSSLLKEQQQEPSPPAAILSTPFNHLPQDTDTTQSALNNHQVQDSDQQQQDSPDNTAILPDNEASNQPKKSRPVKMKLQVPGENNEYVYEVLKIYEVT